MLEENWLPVKGYEDRYLISDAGRVKSFNRTAKDRLGRVRKLPDIFLKPTITSGFIHVGLIKDGKYKSMGLHKLVARHFLEQAGHTNVGFIDGDKKNCHVTNLKWYTRYPDRKKSSKDLSSIYSPEELAYIYQSSRNSPSSRNGGTS